MIAPWVQRHIDCLERRADWLEARVHIAADAGTTLHRDRQELSTTQFCIQSIRQLYDKQGDTR